MSEGKNYDFTISFAGEDREIAEEIVTGLKSKGAAIFYDNDQLAELLGKDLYEHLITIYRDKAKYCIMLVSENYQKKLWTNHERKAAQSRAFQSSNEYILPIRLDNSEMSTLLNTTGYLDYHKLGISKVVDTLVAKLWGDFRNESSVRIIFSKMVLLYQRIGLICENSFRSLNDPKLLELLPADMYKSSGIMINKVKEELQLKARFIDHLVMNELLQALRSFSCLLDMSAFIVQRFADVDRMRVIKLPNPHFEIIINLNKSVKFTDHLNNQYCPDFSGISMQWELALGEHNGVINVDSELLSIPRNDLFIYDMFTLGKLKYRIDNQTYHVLRPDILSAL